MAQQSDEQYLDGIPGTDFVTGEEAVGAIADIVVGLVTLLIVTPIRIITFLITRNKRRGRHRG